MKTPKTHFNEAPPTAIAPDATVEPEADPEARQRRQIAALNRLIAASNDPEERADLREEIGSICMSWSIGKHLAEDDPEDNPPAFRPINPVNGLNSPSGIHRRHLRQLIPHPLLEFRWPQHLCLAAPAQNPVCYFFEVGQIGLELDYAGVVI